VLQDFRNNESCDENLRFKTITQFPTVPDSVLSGDSVLESLAHFFSDVVSCLGPVPPVWWSEVMPKEWWTLYMSADYMKYQLSLAALNMNITQRVMHQPCLFYFSRKSAQINPVSGEAGKVQMLSHVRMEMPLGFAVYLRHVVMKYSMAGNQSKCFYARPHTGEGFNIRLWVDPKAISSIFSVYDNSSETLRRLVLGGVNEQVLTHLGGNCDTIGVNMMSIVAIGRDASVNCNVLTSHLEDYVNNEIRRESLNSAAALILGPCQNTFCLYLDMVRSAIHTSFGYKKHQLSLWDLRRYVEDGMPIRQRDKYKKGQSQKKRRQA
jgi:hypothetical protein